MKKITFDEVIDRADKIKHFQDLASSEFDRLEALIDIINERLQKIYDGDWSAEK